MCICLQISLCAIYTPGACRAQREFLIPLKLLLVSYESPGRCLKLNLGPLRSNKYLSTTHSLL